jgi:TonB family protein
VTGAGDTAAAGDGRLVLAAVLALGLLAAAAGTPGPPDEAALEKLSEGTPAQQRDALDRVLAHTGSTPSVYLFLASAAALQHGRTEDAGFLLYAAQLRSRLDLDRYPPVGKGGDSPGVLIGALSTQVGQAVNPAIMRDPKVYQGVVDRLRAWSPETAKGYDPGWDFGRAQPAAPARVAAEKMKREYLEPAEGMARLLNTPEYFEAFKVLQDFNLDAAGDGPKPEQIAQARQAEERMRTIEQKLGIPGLFYRRPGASPAPAASVAPARSVPAVPVAPKTSVPPRRVGGAIAEPKRLTGAVPALPPDLPPDVPRTVIVEVTVTVSGRVSDARILRGHPAIDRAVVDAVKEWTYEPATEYGVPVPVILTATVNLR